MLLPNDCTLKAGAAGVRGAVAFEVNEDGFLDPCFVDPKIVSCEKVGKSLRALALEVPNPTWMCNQITNSAVGRATLVSHKDLA